MENQTYSVDLTNNRIHEEIRKNRASMRKVDFINSIYES